MLNPLKGLRFVRAANYNPTTMSWPERKQSFTAAAPIFFPKTAAAAKRKGKKSKASKLAVHHFWHQTTRPLG